MLRFVLIVTVLWVIQPIFVRAELNIVYEDIMCTYTNKEYINMHDIYLTDDNAISMNFTVLKRFNKNSRGHAILLGDSMGEYVVPTGINIDMKLCEMLDEPIILGPILGVFGFVKDDCPPPPGNYGSENYVVPTENFPDEFPLNKYLIVLELLDDNGSLVIIQFSFEMQ